MTLRVGIVLVPDVTLLDVAGPAEVFCRVLVEHQLAYETVLISGGGGVMPAFGGVSLANTVTPERAGRLDTLLVAGSDDLPDMSRDPDLLRGVGELAARARRVGSVCTGAFVLAELGLLDGRRATTHWRHAATLARCFPRVRVEPDVLHTRDGQVYTSAGISAGIDLALALVEEDFGADAARRVARELVVFMHRPGGQSQFSAAMRTPLARTSALRQVVDTVLADPGGPHTVGSMARGANLSERHLRRLFVEEVGESPTAWLAGVRVDHACRLLLDGHSVTRTAQLSGFGSDEQLRRAFTSRLGTTPTEYRRRFASTREAPSGTLRARH